MTVQGPSKSLRTVWTLSQCDWLEIESDFHTKSSEQSSFIFNRKIHVHLIAANNVYVTVDGHIY